MTEEFAIIKQTQLTDAAVSRKREQEQEAENRQVRRWRQWRRERLEALLSGPYAEPVKELISFLKAAERPSALIAFVKNRPWYSAPGDVRFEVLALIDAAIVRRRERMGLALFDDAVPGTGQPKNVLLILREFLFPPDGGAAQGVARFNQTTQNAQNTEFSHECVNAD